MTSLPPWLAYSEQFSHFELVHVRDNIVHFATILGFKGLDCVLKDGGSSEGHVLVTYRNSTLEIFNRQGCWVGKSGGHYLSPSSNPFFYVRMALNKLFSDNFDRVVESVYK